MVPLVFGRLLKGRRFKFIQVMRDGPHLWVTFAEVEKGEELPARSSLEKELFPMPFTYRFKDHDVTLFEVVRVALPDNDSRYKGYFVVLFSVKEWSEAREEQNEVAKLRTGREAKVLQFPSLEE